MVSSFAARRRVTLILAGLALGIALAASGQVFRDPTRGRVTDFLRKAREAVQANDLARANDYFRRAKSIYPMLSKPPWLKDETPLPGLVSGETREVLLAFRDRPLTGKEKQQLEDWITRHPLDGQVRNILLQQALRENDGAAIRRHRSVLSPETPQADLAWGTIMALIVTVALIFWQFWGLARDLVKRDTEG